MNNPCPDKFVKISSYKRTSDYYRTKNLPPRFDNPSWFCAYGSQKQPPEHPFYRTTTLQYGWYPPTIHTAPKEFYPRDASFSRHQALGGMYKNFSLNTALDTSVI